MEEWIIFLNFNVNEELTACMALTIRKCKYTIRETGQVISGQTTGIANLAVVRVIILKKRELE